MRARIVLLAAVGCTVAGAPAGAATARAPAPAPAKTFVIEGRGWGHGIGMGQYGAEGFALHGWPYDRILRHYYPGTALGRTPDITVRVLVVEGRSRVALSSRRPYRIRDAAGRAWTVPGRRLVLTPGPHLRARGRRVRLALPLVVEPGASPLRVGNSAYRGSLTVMRTGRALSVVNALSLERYLRGVVGWEMPHEWQPQALAAQAVAARSYALSVLHPGQGFDLYADTRDQVYGGVRAEYEQTDRAVTATAGRILLWGGRVARAYYSSTSGGRTQSLTDALPGLSPVPYLVSVSDPYDRLSPRHRWGPVRFTRAEVAALLRVPRPTTLHLRRNGSGRVATVDVRWRGGGERIGGREFQRRLDLPSTWFSLGSTGPPLTPTPPRRSGRLRGWIVVLGSAPIGDGPARLRALAHGAHAHLIRSSDYAGLRPGFYVAAAGPYGSGSAARAAAARFAHDFAGAYARRLR